MSSAISIVLVCGSPSAPIHTATLTEVVGAHGGRTVDGGVDGLAVVTFASLQDAISATLALHGGDGEHTAGLAVGDLSQDGDQIAGQPLVDAMGLERACGSGQVLVSGALRLLAADRPDVRFEPCGPVDLDGMSEPIDGFALVPTRVDAASPEWRFPAILSGRPSHPMLGRDRELGELMGLWADTLPGAQHTTVLAGEAGVGKTRLATELAHRCHEGGAIVLGGLCDPELSLPYQPWVMMADQLVSQLPAGEIDDLRAELSNLVVLVPRLEKVLGGAPQPPLLDPEAERLRLFEAFSHVLATASELAPILVVVDDLHWAASQTLELLRFLVRNRAVRRGMIVATMRDTPGSVGHALTTTLAEFHRDDSVSHHKVDGIDGGAIHQLLDRSDAKGDLRAQADAIMAKTGGNAFLVTEMIDHSGDRGRDVPTGVVDVVEGRLLQLGGDARWLGNLIAVGSRVRLSVLLECAGADDVELGPALAELTEAGLVEELGDHDPAYQFDHALIREAVVSRLSAVALAAINQRLALALERVYETDRRSVLPELARHFTEAAAVAGWEKAAYYGRRAGAHARRTAAYEEGLELIERSLEVTPTGTEERALLLIDTVDLLERCGRNPEAVNLAEEAFDIGVAVGSPSLMARAGIELERAAHLANAGFDRSPPRLRQVLDSGHKLGEEIRIQTQASLGRALWLNGVDQGRTVAAEALESALSLGDGPTISHVLEMVLVVETDPHEVLRLADALEDTTHGLGNVFQSMWAMTRRTGALIELGRLEEADEVLQTLASAAEQYRFTTYKYLSLAFTHTLALAGCDFDGAEKAAEAANAAEDAEFSGLDVSGAYGLQMFMVRRAQGRLDEMRPVLALLACQNLGSSVWRPGAILAYTELGMVAEARAGLAELNVEAWSELSRDALWPLAVQFLADACMWLDYEAIAPRLVEEFAGLAGQTARAAYTTNAGPADRGRAIVAELAGLSEIADQAIADAHRLARSSSSPLWIAEVEHTWAWILARRGRVVEAEAHRDIARSLADHFGIESVLGQAQPVPDVGALPDGLSAREVEVLVELAGGHTNRGIAERLYISPNTAANHVRSILRKTASANRTEAAAYAFRKGLVGDRPD